MRKTNNLILLACAFFMSSALWAADVTINIYDSQGNPLAGNYKVKLGPNHVKHLGSSTIPSGATIDLTAGSTYTIWAEYDNTSTDRMSLTVDPAGNTVDYNTTNVKFHFSGGYLNYRGSGGWKSFGKTAGEWNGRELFPNDFYGNTMRIQTGYKWNDVRSMEFEIDYSGKTSIEKTIAVLRVLDHGSNPTQGSKARGGYTAIGWHVPGSTNSNGLLIDLRDGKRTSLLYEARVNGTVAVIGPKDPTLDSYYLFQTAELRVRMETCSGDPVDGGSARFKNGSYKYWLNNGLAANSKTGNAAPGEVAGEVFPGSYDVDMQFRYGEVTQTAVVSATGGNTTFKTTNVDLDYAGTITYKKLGGTYAAWYSQPSMEFLPGDYEFKFTGGGTVPVTVGACTSPITISANFIKLESSLGTGIAGATAKYYRSGWKTAGLTDANGFALVTDPLISGNTKFRVEHAGLSNEKYHNITNSGVVVFATKLVSFDLESSTGASIAGATTKYYGAGWKTFGSGTSSTSMELLPRNIKFRVQHAGLSNEKYQNIGTDAAVVFTTQLVTFDLESSTGSAISGATTKYYGAGWKTFGSGSSSASMELLPYNTKFRVEHAGLSNEKYQHTGADAAVVFTTQLVTFDLESSTGTPIAGATTKYYGAGWKTFGSGSSSTSMELLPYNTKFRVEHGGLSNEKYQNTGTDANVVFATVLVDFVLKNSHNTQFLTPSATKYYGAGWKTFTGQTMELLSNNVKFRVEYRGHSNEKYQNIGSNPNVQFNTQKRVLSITNTTYGLQPGVYKWKYYGSGWHDLNPATPSYTSNITYSTLSKKLQAYSELLPGNVKFRVETPCGNAEQYSTLSHITLDVSCDLSNKSASASAPEIETTGIELYPNPTSSQITIEATGTVNIFNASGKLMYSGEAKTLDISSWAQGIYLVRTTTQVEKLIIK